MEQRYAISISNLTTTSRNGKGIFCSDFTGRNNIADIGTGFINTRKR